MSTNNITKALDLLAKASALLGGVAAEAAAPAAAPAEVPSEKVLLKMKASEKVKLAKALGISADDADEADTLLTTASSVVHGDEDTEFDKAEVNALAAAVGVVPSKKVADTVEALKEYFESSAAPAADDDDTEDEAPKKGKGKAKPADDDDDSTDDDDDADEAPKKGKKKADDDDAEESSDDDDGPSDEEKAERLEAYNAVADKPLKNYAKLEALLTDSEGNVAEWGKAYTRGEGDDAEGFCCGMPLDEQGEEGVCQVTGSKWKLNDDGVLVPSKGKAKAKAKPAADDDDDTEEDAPKAKGKRKPAADEDED